MIKSRIDVSVSCIDEIAQARKTKQSLEALSPFLTCSINRKTAKEYVDLLVKHNMLYFFEEDANEVVVYDVEDGYEVEKTFTTKQATMLNVIRNRFMHDDSAFKAMFDAVFCSDADCMVTDDERASEHLEAEYEIVDRFRIVN